MGIHCVVSLPAGMRSRRVGVWACGLRMKDMAQRAEGQALESRARMLGMDVDHQWMEGPGTG